jgi:hypothetical protein
MEIKAQRGVLGLMAIGDEAREQVDEEVVGAAVASVLDLADIRELIEAGRDQGAFAQQEPVGELEELLAPILAEGGDEAPPLREEQALSEGYPDVAFVAQEPTQETMDQVWPWAPLVGVAGSAAKGTERATVVDDQMERETIAPPHRGLAAASSEAKDTLLLHARWVTYRKGGRVAEAPARAGSQVGVEVEGHGHEVARPEFHEARRAHQVRKLLAQGQLHVRGGKAVAGPIARLLQADQAGEELRWRQPRRPAAPPWPTAEQLALPQGLEARPARVDGALPSTTEHYRSRILLRGTSRSG